MKFLPKILLLLKRKRMKLYLLSRPDQSDVDEHVKAVVTALSSADAVKIHPGREAIWNDKEERWAYPEHPAYESSDWIPPSRVVTEYLGKARLGTEQGVILSSIEDSF